MDRSYPSGPKSTWQAQAQSIRNGEVEITESDVPMLLEWLQDMNWPGASTIAEILPVFDTLLIDPLHKILRSSDTVWIHWVLLALKNEFDSDFWSHLAEDLVSIAYKLDQDGAHINAMEILARWKLFPAEKLKEQYKMSQSCGSIPQADYDEIERMLGVE